MLNEVLKSGKISFFQMRFKKESHYLELGETGLTKNLSTTGG